MIPHAKCLHVHMLPCRVNSYFVHSIVFINNSIHGQTHTTALHSRFTNCAPNPTVLTSQGSWIEIDFHCCWRLLWNVSLFPPSYTAARNASLFWYSILTSFNTILIPCLHVLLSLHVLHTLWMHACRQKFGVKLNLVGRGLKSKFGVKPVIFFSWASLYITRFIKSCLPLTSRMW